MIALAGAGDAGQSGQPATWVSWLKLLLGVLLLVVAVRQFRARPHQGEQITLPKWMGAIDRVKPGQALGGAVILSVLCLVIGMNLLGDALSRLSS